MTHEVSFYDLDKYPIGSKDRQTCAYFGGYAKGIMYHAFDAQSCNGFISGTFQGVEKTREELIQSLNWIRESEIAKTYLDPERFPLFFKEIDSYLKQNPDSKRFEVFFE